MTYKTVSTEVTIAGIHKNNAYIFKALPRPARRFWPCYRAKPNSFILDFQNVVMYKT